MSTNEQSMDVMAVLEKIGETLSGFSERLASLITRLFGSSNERTIRRMGYIRTRNREQPYTITPGSQLAQVNALEEKTRALSDEELKGLTLQFRERLSQGAALEELLPEAFAACREAG